MPLSRRSSWLAAIIGMVAGCQFHSEFLIYAFCAYPEGCDPGTQNCAVDCDPAWGEKRTPMACLRPDLELNAGYCTVECETAADCPDGEGDLAGLEKACRKMKLHGKGSLQSECVLLCDSKHSCPEGMVCELALNPAHPAPYQCMFAEP